MVKTTNCLNYYYAIYILYIHLIIFTATTMSSRDPNNNTWMIIAAVMIAAAVIVTVILIVTCLRYRKILKRENARDVGKIQNAVYEEDIHLHRKLPKIPRTDGDYEQPAEYAQLDSSKRVHVDENYQSLKANGNDQFPKKFQ